mmetsp:Transcript_37710/g.121007  ORF Transcript_37710/g.121007 Transcript_37710/m.121007 type:complete len:489 (-) Transcript_37710:69-1535(-)
MRPPTMMVVTFVLVAFCDGRKKAWSPEVPHHEGSMREAVLRELERSLERYPLAKTTEDAHKNLARHLGCYDRVILVVEGRVFLSVRHYHLGKHKPQYHLQFVRSVVARSRDFPNFAYVFEEGAKGTSGSRVCANYGNKSDPRADDELPHVAIAKHSGYSQPGVLIPNPYVANVSTWDRQMKAERQAHVPWPDRDPRCSWRGALTDRGGHCEANAGNYARFCAIVRSSEHPKLLDVKAVARFEPPKADDGKGKHCVKYDEDMRKAAERAKHSNKSYVADFMHYTEFPKYKMLLNLPGVMGGSYSRHLNHLWNAGSVVVLWNAPFVEWYYPALRHGETHVAVDCATFVDRLKYYNGRNGTLLEGLRAAAARVYDEFLSPGGLARYFHDVATALRARLGFDKVLDDPQARFDALTKLDCPSFFFTEVLTSEQWCGPEPECTRATFTLKMIRPDDPVLGPCAQKDRTGERHLRSEYRRLVPDTGDRMWRLVD